MTDLADLTIDPSLDLVLERWVDVPPDLVWAAWTEPRHIVRWFTPAPYTTPACDIDLRPGGRFRVVMRSPEGQEMASEGCYLEVTPGRRLIWTAALTPGYRPAPAPTTATDFPFTGVISIEAQGPGTKYTAVALHRNEEDRAQHEAMGFHDGWGKALDQLVALMRGSPWVGTDDGASARSGRPGEDATTMHMDIYVNFDGTCAEAFRTYQQHLGGTVDSITTFRELPGPSQVDTSWLDRVVHARMTVGGAVLLGADVRNAEPMRSAYLTLDPGSVAETERVFGVLADGGQVFMALQETFFARRFAQLRDRFGVNWMILHPASSGS